VIHLANDTDTDGQALWTEIAGGVRNRVPNIAPKGQLTVMEVSLALRLTCETFTRNSQRPCLYPPSQISKNPQLIIFALARVGGPSLYDAEDRGTTLRRI
jgi:hypothetical protein